MVMLNDAFNEAGVRDVMTLMPVMYLLITVMLFIVLKSKSAVATTMGVMVLSIMGAMGFSGWAAIPITPPSSIAPTVIMTLAIAHSIHILKTLFKTMSAGADQEQAIVESLRQNLRPVFLTSLTTIIGFLSLNFSDTPPFHDLGNITAMGVALPN
jgi:predicted RND superfamily exporter protein